MQQPKYFTSYIAQFWFGFIITIMVHIFYYMTPLDSVIEYVARAAAILLSCFNITLWWKWVKYE